MSADIIQFPTKPKTKVYLTHCPHCGSKLHWGTDHDTRARELVCISCLKIFERIKQ